MTAKTKNVHQLRAGHWSTLAQYLHRIGRNPSNDCESCTDVECAAARCTLCQEEADTPAHVLLRCPALMITRFRLLGTIRPTVEDVQSADVAPHHIVQVHTTLAAYRSLQSRSATS